MTLTELRYLVALAAERHFGHAAERCFVSQPTLSVAIKKFEDELGVALFERGNNELQLTPIGIRIVQQAERTLAEADRIKDIASEGKDHLSGTLRLGAIYTSVLTCCQYWPPCLPNEHRSWRWYCRRTTPTVCWRLCGMARSM